MARDKALQANIDGSDLVNYPNKRIRNNSGVGDGTPVDEIVYGDIHEFTAKCMRDAKMTYNGLPDNVTNGYQLYDAMMSLAGKNDLIKPVSVFNPTTLLIPVHLLALKLDEQITFRAAADSDPAFVLVKGSNGTTKTLVITGSWKAGDKVRLINNNANIEMAGLYDSANVDNLPSRLTNLENSIGVMLEKLAVFQADGAMVFWNKPAAAIPAGWQEVVNWRGRMPVGMNPAETSPGNPVDPEFFALGQQGGSKKKTILEANLPKHHVKLLVPGNAGMHGSDTFQPDANSGVAVRGSSGGDNDYWIQKPLVAGAATIGKSSEVGNDVPQDVLNPYRTVIFIEYIN
ncbi:MAG: hypothetical protein V4547_16390 [Bacteroidota bacterium]